MDKLKSIASILIITLATVICYYVGISILPKDVIVFSWIFYPITAIVGAVVLVCTGFILVLLCCAYTEIKDFLA